MATMAAAFVPSCHSGRLSFSLELVSPVTTTTTTTTFIPRKTASLLYATADANDNSDKGNEKSDDETSIFETPSLGNIPASLNEPSPSSKQQQSPKVDPLIASLTRMDEATQMAPTVQVPVWGELILDRSLFVLLPIALFAVGGLLLSIQVATHSVDAIVDATANSAASSSIPDPEACRGLCSDQEQSYYGLQTFMNKLAGK